MAETKYNPETVQIITDAIKAGDTDKQAAEKAGIHRATFYEWENNRADFADIIKNARKERTENRLKEIGEAAESGLIALLRGSDYIEEKTETLKDGSIKTTKTRKVIPPNPTAVIFALCNRNPERWQNKVTGEIKQDITTENKTRVDLSRLKDETIQELIKELEAVPLPE